MNTISKKHIGRKVLTGLALAAVGAAVVSFTVPHLIESIIRRTCAEEQSSKSELGYFQKVASEDTELAPILKNNGKRLRAWILDILGKLKHATPKGYPNYLTRDITVWENPTAEELSQLTEVQLIKMYYLLKALQDPAFRKKIGTELEKDTTDRTGEHGGVLHLENKDKKTSVRIEMIPNEDLGNPYDFEIGSHHWNPDEAYNPKYMSNSQDMMGPFHFHACTISPEHAAFSGNDFFVSASMMGFTEIFLFSRPDDSHFNVDMGIVPLEQNGRKIRKRLDLDLGVYDY